jgi:HD-like signal output (HDOD) protein
MIYRIHQFYQALRPKIGSEELQWAFDLLPPPAIQLFLRQSLAEQRHALDVALDLWSGSKDRNLIIAALLHDCGKIKSPLNLLARIYIVVLQRTPRKTWDFLLHSYPFFSSPLLTAQEHPAWGAELALELGLDSEIVELILNHHFPKTQKGRLLYVADNRH